MLVRLRNGFSVHVVPFNPGAHRVSELTSLLHRAYADLADLGFRYLATHQDDATTLRRAGEGECFVALIESRPVGTITWTAPPRESKCAYYCRPDVATFGQFAVEPALQHQGLGDHLLSLVEARARDRRIPVMALDTAEGATHLVAYYSRRGYSLVDHVHWGSTNYRSVILAKPLLHPPPFPAVP